MKYQDFCQDIIRHVGGKKNIKAVVHCMTRLRFTLVDRDLADTEKLKEMDGVIDVVSNQVAYQVIVGTHVKDVYQELIEMLGLTEDQKTPKEKKNVVKAIFDVVSESMNPILEPIICAGLLAAFLSIISLTGLISPESPTYQILDTLRGAVFFFLPIFMAMSSAKRLGASPYLAVALAATLLSEQINGVKGLSIFGIGLPEITYANSFIPILIAVWFMGLVTKWVKKIVPEVLSYFLNPVIIMLITLPMTLLVFGPVGFYIGEGIIGFFTFLMDTIGSWFVMMLYSALQPFIILLGAGNFIMPVVATLLADKGFDPAFISSCTISDIAVGGAMLGYFLRARNVKQKSLFGTVTLSAVLGVTEPAIYGVFVKFRRPFIAVMIGGGLGGLFAGLTGVKAYSMAWGLFGLPSYIGGNGDFKNLALMVTAVIISFVVSAIAAYLLFKPEESEADTKQEVKVSDEVVRSIPLTSVANGELVQLADIKDQAFSSGALGKGIGIISSGDDIYAPFDGEVVMVFDTKHAIGLRDENGVEVLIHIGIDTVELEGQGFEVLVESGAKIRQGQKIAQVNFNEIKAAGYDPTVIVVVTNTADFLDVIPATVNNILTSASMLSVVL
ncbi:beta-glucoside-specific PTS transporter subunit IIABC [Vagococcus silagei]|uniref:PTS system sucrose-specific EIIBCA component n=1 Tax=Vagococcus silagei TaxID=2508885 RepID=A0A4S3B5Z3_9ENTE|nr:beta-glucoside-specific PTS transporter subunit IIABC [Vagococcus silagei]THB60916.1 PTS beta-glucoside transporter subunit IIBCA [Vagococcus silagei]